MAEPQGFISSHTPSQEQLHAFTRSGEPGKLSKSSSQSETGLKETVEALEHFKQKAHTFSEALMRETRRSERLQQEKDQLQSVVEKLHEEFAALQAELDELRSQKAALEERNIRLGQELKRPSKSSLPFPRYFTKPDENTSVIVQYLDLVLERLEATPELKALYVGRVPLTTDLKIAVSQGETGTVLRKMMQVMSDFLAFYLDSERPKCIESTPEKLTTGTQTTIDRSILTEQPVEVPFTASEISSSIDSHSSHHQHIRLMTSLNRHSSRLDELTRQLAASQQLLRTQRTHHSSLLDYSQRGSKLGERNRQTGYHSSRKEAE